MFEVVCKKSHISRQTMKLIVKVCLVLHVGLAGTQNQALRPLPDLFRATNPMAISELTNEFPLKITFFKVSTIVSICMKF